MPDPPRARGPARAFQPLRDLPALFWLLLVAVAAILHRGLPVPHWLLLHLLFLGAITHSILVWSQHFSFALTRAPQTDATKRDQSLRLAAANIGVVLVLLGVPLAVWPLTVAGVVLLSAAVVWHGISIFRRMRGALPGRFTRTVRYYVVSAAFLPIGAAIGAWLTGPLDTGGAAARLVLAHAVVNVLGWVGVTVAGTLVTLWPTMLRTRAAERSADRAATALPILAGGVAVAAVGAGVGALPLLALGLAGYAAGLGVIAGSLVRAAMAAPPRDFPTLSAGAALLWWIGCLAHLAVQTAIAWAAGAGFEPVHRAMDAVVPFLAAGFAAQVLLGALSYLAPVSIGGGPAPVKAGTAVLNRFGPLRVTVANAALLVCALPVPDPVRTVAFGIALGALATFIPLFLVAIARQGRAKRGAARPAPAA